MPQMTPPIRLGGGLYDADDASFSPPTSLRLTTGCRYAPDDERLRRAQGRTAFSTAAPGSGTASIEALDFNAAADQLVMFQGTGAYIAAVGTTGTFAAANGQTEFTSVAATAFTVTTQTTPITKVKYGDAFIIADAVSRPAIMENNFRMRSLGLIQPKWSATFTNPGSAGTALAAQTTVSTSGTVQNIANAYDADTESYATLVKGGTDADAVAVVGWTSTTNQAWSLRLDLSGSALRKDDGNQDLGGPEPTMYIYRVETSTDSGTTFSEVRGGGATTGRVTLIDNLATTAANNVQVRLTLLRNNDNVLTGSASLNWFDVALINGGATTTYSTANSGLRYAFTEVRKYQRLLPGQTDPTTIEIESAITPLSPDEDADPHTFTSWYGNQITRGTLANSDATHWRIYRSTDGVTNDDTKSIDIFSRIAELDASVSTFVDTFDEGGHPMDFQNTALAPPVLIVGDLIFDANTPPPDNVDVVGSYQGCAVYASPDKPGRFWWSRPLQPDYVPALYGDLIPGTATAFVDVGVLLVFTPQSVDAYSILPVASDTDFIPSRRARPVSRTRGCVSRRGAALYQPRVSEILCAFVASDGLYVTNGAQVELLSSMLDWPTRIPTTSLASAILLDDVAERSLRLIYVDSASNTQCLTFSYGRGGNVIRPTGPQRWPSSSTAPILQSDGTFRIFSEQSGLVYLEASGTSDAANLEAATGTITLSAQTQRFYPFGPGGKGRLENVVIHTPAATGATMTATVNVRIDGKAATSHAATLALDLDGWKTVGVGEECESFDVTFVTTSTNFPGISAIAATLNREGELDAGRVEQ